MPTTPTPPSSPVRTSRPEVLGKARWWIGAALLLPGMAAFSSPRASQEEVPPRPENAALVERISTMLTERYVFPDVAEKCAEALRARLAAGALDELVDPEALASQLTELLRGVASDKHLLVRERMAPSKSGETKKPFPLRDGAQRRDRARSENFGFASVERLEGNVGLVNLRSFASPRDGQGAAVAAMALVENTDALIFDLRKNGGGSPGMVQFLSSHLFEEPTHINSLYWREGDQTQEFWTLPGVPGVQRPDVPVFVLVSSETFSAAEEFSYNLQALKRATIVGETTRGGAHPGGLFPINEQFEMVIPTGRAINPITGTNWEGVGVKPDVEVGASEALEAALRLAGPAAETFRESKSAPWDALEQAYHEAIELSATGKSEAAAAKIESGVREALLAGIVGEPEINALGYEFLGSELHTLAVATLSINVTSFPESANAYDSFGESLRAVGEIERAITNYERALELDPDGPNSEAARKSLAELRDEAERRKR